MPADEHGSTRVTTNRLLRIGGKVVAGALSAAVVLSTGTAWSAKYWYDSKVVQVEALDEESADIQDEALQEGAENFLLVGSDSRIGSNSNGKEAVSGARSDVVMLAHVPADRARAVVVSFPRDLEITTPECNRWQPAAKNYTEEVVPERGPVKLNAAYAYGGPRCVTKLVQRITGVRVNHFIGIEFDGFKEMVDAVGGVTMRFDAPIVDRWQGRVIAKPGTVTLDGDRALRLVRSRQVAGDPTGDYGRIERQQKFIGSLLDKIGSRDVLLKPSKLGAFARAFTGSTFGENIGVDQLLTLARSMREFGSDRVVFRTVPTTGSANERGNEVLDKAAAQRLFHSLINNAALPKPR